MLLFGGIGFMSISHLSQLQINETSVGNNESVSSGSNANNILTSNATLFVLLGWLIALVGCVLSVVGCASFIVAWGILKGKLWARFITTMITIISIVFNAISASMGNILGIVGIILNGITIYYLNRKEVKFYFKSMKAVAE